MATFIAVRKRVHIYPDSRRRNSSEDHAMDLMDLWSADALFRGQYYKRL